MTADSERGPARDAKEDSSMASASPQADAVTLLEAALAWAEAKRAAADADPSDDDECFAARSDFMDAQAALEDAAEAYAERRRASASEATASPSPTPTDDELARLRRVAEAANQLVRATTVLLVEFQAMASRRNPGWHPPLCVVNARTAIKNLTALTAETEAASADAKSTNDGGGARPEGA